jgi:hypothetical protein
MLFAVSVGIIVFLLILAAFLYIGHDIFDDFGNRFLYVAAGLLVLVFAAGIFLTHAVPSLANANPFQSKTDTQSSINQDSPVGLTLQDE